MSNLSGVDAIWSGVHTSFGVLRHTCMNTSPESVLRWQPGVSQCEIREIEVFNIDLSRPSPVSKLGGGVH